ncbi:aminotransferase class III-fold pyridoxal phosphate-dependent enzyme [Streptomyces microflavus]|uniref:aminotransferase class III-fold pyridoxal phosphate-dependent enzyme n=1 Tax=Streptomyces microflavus TaxID=1919 RepID=UPI00224EBDD3|nr:aminotransferase class III-fold pyridoxal phosphate-dependent enzyme [Streptomyces microflavus]MCX4650912.1 aminotransferase class III-fold pyridoxal phosphate-dependent enzyme [Streptomyces microflavus]
MTSTTAALLSYTYESPKDFRVYSSGRGVYLYTRAGQRVLDGLSGSMNANLGHGNAAVAAAMYTQALGLTAVPSVAGDVSDDCVALAEKLRGVLQLPDVTCLFASSGSEATEAALAIVWKYWSEMGHPGKAKVLSLDGSYHGCTIGALALTGRADEHADVPPATNFRLALPAWDPYDASRVSTALERTLIRVGAETVAAIFLEPVMGLAGMVPAPRADLRKVVGICRANNILVVLDEALTGLGRAGHSTAAESYGVDHDLLLVSKGLGCGFVPISATCIASRIASVLRSSSPTLRHGHTASGNPMAARVASTVLDELAARDAMSNAGRMEGVFKERMTAGITGLRGPYSLRSTGLCLAVETADPAHAQQVRHIAFDLGLRIRAIDRNIIACPPLVITEQEMTEMAALLARALAIAEQSENPR